MQNLNQDSQLQEALQLLKNNFKLQKAYLFGSRTQNTSHSDSDYDLMIVAESSSVDAFERRVLARKILKGLSASFDVFVYTPEEFEELKNDFGSIVETAVNTGQEVEFL